MGTLSTLNIARQKFKKVLRGYDTEEVDVFLEMISEKFDELQKKNDKLESQVDKLETQLSDYQKNEKNINEILYRTKEMQEEAKYNIEKQQEMIIRDAEFKAVEILENSRKEFRQIKDEILELQHKKESFSSRLKYLIHSYLDLLKMLEAESLIEEDEEKIPLKTQGKAAALLKGKRKKQKTINKTDLIKIPAETNDNDEIDEQDDEILIDDFDSLIENIDSTDIIDDEDEESKV